MKNRIASLFLVFAMLMSLCNFAVARDNRITVQSGGAEKFTDVPTDHWAYAYINKVVGSGLFNGKSPTTFEPSNAMTRSQFVLVMDRMEGMSSLEGQYTTTIFPDVAPGRLAAGPIKWANEQGFVLGFGDGTFKPDSPITRGQFAALIHRYIIAKRYTNLHVVDPEPAQFTDAGSVSSAFTEDVEYARVHGLLTGYSDGTVRASNPITRAAIAAILARFLDLVTESGYTPLLDGPDGTEPGPTPGTDGPETPPVDVPTSYKQIKLNVTNTKRGTTTFLSVLRNGVQVAADDVQPGDVVTISHVPVDGYYATIAVKDSKGKTVTVTTNGNISTFVAPENLPVTITLKYLKESSGGSSGGGGGGGGGGSGGSGGGSPVASTTPYYLSVNASVSGGSGSVYLTQSIPPVDSTVPADITGVAQGVFQQNNLAGVSNVSVYAVFVPEDSYELKSATSEDATLNPAQPPYTADNVKIAMKRADGSAVNVTCIRVTARGGLVRASAPSANVFGVFGTITGGDTPSQDLKWTVNVIDSDEYSFYALVKTQDEVTALLGNPQKTALTANGEKTVSFDSVTDGTTSSVYLVVSPKTGFKFGELDFNPADTNISATPVNPTTFQTVSAAALSETDTLRVYRISKSQFTTASTVTGVSILMQVEDGVGRTHNVTVKSFLDMKEADTTVPVRASVDKPTATWLNKVTVKVPVIKTPNGYDFASINVTNASGAVISDNVRLKAETPDKGNVYYSFIMPDNDVVVKVTYQRVANENLNYNVTVNVNGKQGSDASAGSVSVNIAGVTVTTDTTKTYNVTMSNGAVTVTDTASDVKMKQSQYLELYPKRTDYKLPVYLTATPVAAKGYKFNSVSNNVVVKSDSMTDAQQFVLENGKTLVITATFEKITSYGYNLTIIGQGTVGVNFNGKAVSPAPQNNSALPQTFSSGLVVTTNNKLTLSTPTGLQSGYVASAPVVNGEQKAYGQEITLTEGKLDEIVVDIHKADRQPVKFDVTVSGNGKVEISPASGRVVEYVASDSVDAVKAKLDVAATTPAPLTLTSGTASYYAYEDAVITLNPVANAATVKVSSIKVSDTQELTDIMSTQGFSFQLKAPTTATVTFGTFDSYTVQAQAAPTGGGVPRMNSESTKVAENHTVAKVLESLNDGQRDASTTNKDNIVNSFLSAPSTINKTLSYYMTHNVASVTKDGVTTKQTGAKSLEDMLADTVKSNIADIVPSVIESKKTELKNNSKENIEDPLSAQMQTKQTTADKSVTITGAVKSDIIAKILEKDTTRYSVGATGNLIVSTTGTGQTLSQLYAAKTIRESDFTITANITPILSEDKVTNATNGLAQQYPALKDQLTGKSAESQILRFVQDYLGKMQITNGTNLEPEITVSTSDVNVTSVSPAYTYPQITVSAQVGLGAGGAWPTLDNSVINMSSYSDQLTVWVLAQISQINVKGVAVSMTSMSIDPSLYNSSQFSSDTSAQDVRDALAQVDRDIAGKWSTKFGELLTGGKMSINMQQVLTKELLDTAIEDAIQEPSDKMVDKIESLGKGDTTRAAFMNLYRDFVVFQNNTLYLKSRNSDTAYNLGTVGTNLVLTLDFERILRDAYYPNKIGTVDNMPFEKLADLIMALRNGISEDIRSNAKDSKASQSVIAALIESQISKNKGTLKAVKWGTAVGNGGTRALTEMERKELSNLLAGLLMNTETSDPMSTAWKDFEKSGYSSVEFNVTLDALKRGGISGLIESYFEGGSQTKLDIGFKIAQEIA